MQEPYALLQAMQQASLENSPGLPEEVQVVEHWSGLGFKLDDLLLVAYLDQVSEVLPCPELTPVPGTKDWVKGVVNVRGILYTVIDLPGYLGRPMVAEGSQSRILVLNRHDVASALFVPDVLGLKHFEMDVEQQDISGLDNPVVPYLSGAFLSRDQLWGIFDVNAIAESPTFRHLAA